MHALGTRFGRTGRYFLQQLFEHLYVTGNLLSASPFPSPPIYVLGDKLIPTIRLPMLGPFPPAHWLNLKKSSITLANPNIEQGMTNPLGMPLQHHRTKLACCLGLCLFVAELGSLGTSLKSSNSGPDT